MSFIDPFDAVLQEWVAVFMRRSMQSFIRYARQSGLSMSQINTLFHIHHAGGSGVTDLGEHLGITNAAVSQLLERLVQQGLILRDEDPADRRAKKLTLTEKGAQTLQEGIHARQGWLHDLSATLSVAEKEQITVALKILIDKTKRLEYPAAAEN
jgi:DNA-binding MarR family transcriptional regulator